MPYTPQVWTDGAAGGTPLSAARLTIMETGIEDADTRLTLTAVGARLTPGYYIGPQGAGRSTLAMVASTEYASPVHIAGSGTLARIGLEVTVAAAGSTVRLGIRADNGTGQPGTLLVDAGTVDGSVASSSGTELTISQPVTPGLYWFTATAQGGAPTIRAALGDLYPAAGNSLASALSAVPNAGYATGATVTGALPNSFTVGLPRGVVPRIVVRI